jgi:hypothetical protein
VYYFDYYRGEEDKKQKEQSSILIPILKEDVSRVELKNSSGELELVRSEKGWDLKKPVTDFAATDESNGWVQSLTTEKSVEKIGEGENFEWSTYGLDKPSATLVVHPKSGTPIKLEISAKRNFEGNPFIRKNDEKIVYVANVTWNSLMEKAAKEIRDKRILREPLAELESVTLSQGKSQVRVNIVEGKWVAQDKPTWRLDQNKVREVINVPQDMKAVDFVLEGEPDKTQASTYGLVSPSLKVTYQLKGGKAWVAEFGQSKDKVWYVWPKDLKKVAKVDTSQVEKITKATLLDWRDREEPFIFNKDDVKKLNIAAEKHLELSKDGEAWKASLPGSVEGTEVSQLLDRLRDLRVTEFMDGKITAPGIEKSKKQFVLADTQGKNLFELKIGDSFKKKEDKVEKTYVYAKSSIYPDVVILKEDDVKALAVDKLIKEPNKDAETNKPADLKAVEETKNQ